MSSLAGSSVALHVRLLRGAGFLRAARGGGRHVTSLHDAYRCLALAATTTYLVQELIYAYQERRVMERLARVLFLLLCHVTSLVKQLVLVLDADRVDRLIQSLDDPLFNLGDARSTLQLQATTRGAARLARLYVGTAVVTCVLWIVFPILDHVKGNPVEFPLYIYVDTNRTPTFIVVLIYTYLVTSLVGIANTSMDAFMGTILLQSKTQLSILRDNLENLFESAEAESAGGGGARGEVHLRLLLRCLQHYNKVVETTKLFQDIFGTAILVQFTIGGWILCLAAYKIVSLNMFSIEFASMILFIMCILTELFIYCYYGNEVSVESEGLVSSLYLTGWRRAGRGVRRALLLAMERAQRPLAPTAGRVLPLSLNTFIQILKSSYTFYAVLRQTKYEE
ncbi:odorant receptor 94b [Plutella xylostella]|uniref:odorant receptor 94b n=1 Tax=Plutella xylostella TaxID=51655 RepID=UPI002032FD73|nr:odorant receptor 94b [Plutella xylostella]